MKRIDSELLFAPLTQINIIEERFKAAKYIQDDKLLYFQAFYRLGNLKTDEGNDVLALKFLKDSLDILLLEPIAGTVEVKKIVDKHPHTVALEKIGMPHEEIIPEYNCHGLCFGDSLYRIPDAKQILTDEYKECGKKDATCLIYFDNNITVHAVLIENDILLSKAGYRGLHNFNKIEDAAGDIAYDTYSYYKPRKT